MNDVILWYVEKDNRTLECSSAINIWCTEIIVSQSQTQCFYLLNATIFVKSEEKLSKCEHGRNSIFPQFGIHWKSVQIYSHLEIKIKKL